MTARHESWEPGRGLIRAETGVLVVEGVDGVAVLLVASREAAASREVGQRVLDALGGPVPASSSGSSSGAGLGWALAAASGAPGGEAAETVVPPPRPAEDGGDGRDPGGAEDAAGGESGAGSSDQRHDQPGDQPHEHEHDQEHDQDPAVPQAALGAAPVVLASLCPDGHANPPDLGRCVRCGQHLPGRLSEVRRPVLVVLSLSTGQSVPVAGDVVVGRAPWAPAGSDPAAVTLVPVPSPTHLVSRCHLAVTTAGWSVLACDLGSSNGTVLIRAERSPLLLETGVSVPLLVGDVLDVGDGVTLRVDPPWQPGGGL